MPRDVHVLILEPGNTLVYIIKGLRRWEQVKTFLDYRGGLTVIARILIRKQGSKRRGQREAMHEIRILLVIAGFERGKGAPQTKEWELLGVEKAWKQIYRAPRKKHGPSGSLILT